MLSSAHPIYPGGTLGGGLALLRLSAAGALLSHCALPTFFGGGGGMLMAAISALVATGAFTRWVAVIGAFVLAANSGPLAAATVITALNLIVITFTGPGAYSIDARRGGRVRVKLPSDRPGA